ncbi:excalibur calcium-binding domain-containing protein [Kitasatospora sp. NPDC088346]|uniref:excalibur calcium-binding domain-containing protein n=1 Tax=Kitasatospora sp. NPDC088346 TaxID=3364073 RepID=UPI00382AB319
MDERKASGGRAAGAHPQPPCAGVAGRRHRRSRRTRRAERGHWVRRTGHRTTGRVSTAGAPTLAQPASHRCTAEPGYRPELDQDGDGVACEPPP